MKKKLFIFDYFCGYKKPQSLQEVQKQLCRALTLLLDIHLDKLAPHLANITEFMLIKTQVCLFVLNAKRYFGFFFLFSFIQR